MNSDLTFTSWIHIITRFIETSGISVIVVGLFTSTIIFFKKYRRVKKFESIYHDYRSSLGRAILLGLELLVAGDIILTVAIDPTIESAAVLGLIVLIRTFLSFTLEVEIKGYWPWQEASSQHFKKSGDTDHQNR